MLRSIHLKDFKSFADEQVRFAPLTVLVGANASGKSNLLDAIRVVQGLGLGFSLAETLQGRSEGGREIWKGIRGGAFEAIRSGEKSASVVTEWEWESERVRLDFSFSVKPNPFLHLEELSLMPLEVGGEVASLVKVRPQAPFEHHTHSVLFALEPGGKPETGTVRAYLVALRHMLQGLVMLEIAPARMRSYAPKHALEMGSEGEPLSAVIWSRSRTEDERLEWVDWLSELCSPEITDLDFIETQLGDVMLVLVEKDGTRTSARALSDGTLRFLGTLVALRTAPRGSIFLIEEIEQGMHPQRIHLLVEFLETVTRERDIQVIATTHSPQVLQSLSSEGLNNAVLCARTADRPGTVLRIPPWMRTSSSPSWRSSSRTSGAGLRLRCSWIPISRASIRRSTRTW